MLGKRALQVGVGVLAATACWLLAAGPATAAPANDEYAGATEVTGFPVSFSGDNTEASKTEEEWDGTAGENIAAGRSIWFKWTAPASELVKIDACEGNFDTIIAVFTGATFEARSVKASNDEHEGLCAEAGPHPAALAFDAVEGTTYRILVDTYDESEGEGLPLEGSIPLSIHSPVPDNDAFGTPQIIESEPLSLAAQASGNNSFASKEAGEPNHGGDSGGASLWYLWKAPKTGIADALVCDPEFVVDVYEGTEVGNLTPVTDLPGVEDCDGVYFQATEDTFYSIAVDGKFDGSEAATGNFDLFVVMPPANDLLENAEVITGDSFETDEITVGALTEEMEPLPNTFSVGSSVWFSWTAPKAGDVALATCGSTYDTIMVVYATPVTAVGSVGEPVALNDDSSGPNCATEPEEPEGPPSNRDSELSFQAEAGTTYKIAVYGYADIGGVIFGESGILDFSLQRTDLPAPPPGGGGGGDTTAPETKLGKKTVKGKKRKATFAFTSTEAGSTFTCKLDKKAAKPCKSPVTFKKLKPGKHTLAVTAVDAAGNADATPATAKFKIPKPKKKPNR